MNRECIKKCEKKKQSWISLWTLTEQKSELISKSKQKQTKTHHLINAHTHFHWTVWNINVTCLFLHLFWILAVSVLSVHQGQAFLAHTDRSCKFSSLGAAGAVSASQLWPLVLHTDRKQPFSKPVREWHAFPRRPRISSRFHFLRHASVDRCLLTVVPIRACE